MKRIFLLLWSLFLLASPCPVLAQKVAPAQKTYTYVEQMPTFPGGQQALFQLVGSSLHYPTEALQQRLEGRVVVSFLVDTAGAVRDVQATEGLHELLKAEAVRVIAALPAFTPGRQLGRPVPVRFSIPLTFRLPDDVALILAERAVGQQGALRPAAYPGGPEALRAYLRAVPLPAGYMPGPGASNKVFVAFTVDSTGRASQVTPIEPLPQNDQKKLRQSPTLAAPPAALVAAATAHISTMPVWTPARVMSRARETSFTVPVSFGGSPATTALAYADQMPILTA